MIKHFGNWAAGSIFVLCGVFGSIQSWATVVQVQTSMGDFEINLYDDTTPETVDNFLTYIEAGAYENNIFHRAVTGFVIQGGGFQITENNLLAPVTTPWSPINEPVYANVRGTIAMAKLGGDPNSATSQWFVNLGDNRANLDNQNGGFTVFGQVVGDGMDVVDAIAALNRFNLGGALSAAPVMDGIINDSQILDSLVDSLVVIYSVVITDASVDSAANLDRPLTTKKKSKKKKGGSWDWSFLLLVLLALGGMKSAGSRRIRL